MRLILASASSRRQELLHDAGIEFVVQPANIAEDFLAGETPTGCAERLARAKALAVAGEWPGDFVLGADTVVAVGNEILGKPADERDAARMLHKLSGRQHVVITGVCLTGPISETGKSRSKEGLRRFVDVRSETTEVEFAVISDEDIEEYVRNGEPMDKAGAYAIQGGAAKWIPKIQGDYSNVVGLPVNLVKEMLSEH